MAVVLVIVAAIMIAVGVGLSRTNIWADSSARLFGSSAAASKHVVIAWNPSHQDDTGGNGWHEYAVCGDITKRTMALLGGFTSVLCWKTNMGLTSSGDAALKAECAVANAAHAQVFIAVHVNGNAGSGLSGDYRAGDLASAAYAEALLKSVASTMGMTYLYVRPRTSLVVLDPVNNHASIRVLLELGDNVADRALLMSAKGRQRLAAALAKAVEKYTPQTLREES